MNRTNAKRFICLLLTLIMMMSLVPTAVFAYGAANLIQYASIEGVDAPVAGELPDTSASVTEGSIGYRVAGSIDWYDKTNNRTMGEGERFQPGVVYQASVWLQPKTGYEFMYKDSATPTVQVTMNGKSATVLKAYEYNAWAMVDVRYTFPATIDLGDYCPECGLLIEGDACRECGACEDCVLMCRMCGICELCENICPECGEVCDSCAYVCPECGACEHCVSLCLACGECENCANFCPDCWEICDSCAWMCPTCGVCENCTLLCPECHNCGHCNYICPECGTCHDHVDAWCVECGYCENCVDLCLSCGECENCADLCFSCWGVCDSCANICPGCGICENCVTLCPDCNYCGHCIDHCSDCGKCEECCDCHGEPPVIATHPSSTTVKATDNLVLFVGANGENMKYLWQYMAPGSTGWRSTSGTKSTFTLSPVGTAKNGYQYRCKVYNDAGEVFSNAATLNVVGFTSHPAAKTVASGDKAVFSVATVGSGLTYQWQYKTPTSTTWKDTTFSGNKTATLTVTTKDYHDRYQYRCVVTAENGLTVSSNAAVLTVEGAPRITTHPTGKSVSVGEKAQFTVVATGKDLTYQWQYKTSNSPVWKNTTFSGNKTAALTVTAKDYHNGYQYRCVITDANGKTVTSAAAPLRVISAAGPSISLQPKDKTVNVGEKATFTITASGRTLTYQWQYKTPTGTSWKNTTFSGNKTATLTVTTKDYHDGYEYRCVVTDISGKTATSTAAQLTVTINGAIVITSQPTDKNVKSGDKVALTVAADGSGLKYQWQYKTANGTKWYNSKASSATTDSLSITAQPIYNGYQYRCLITDKEDNDLYSKPAKVNVLGITTQPGSLSVKAGEKGTFKVIATGGNLTYQWQYKTATGTKWYDSSASSAKTDALTVTAQTKYDGYQYRCKVSNSAGTVTSNAARLSVG